VSSIAEEKHLAAVLPLMAGANNEGGETALWVGSAQPEALGDIFYPYFLHSVFAGLVPPFSHFFYAVRNHYGLHALHPHPNSILLLLIFAFYCKAFVGVMPSVAMFRHFFYLRISSG
jgi:hypothetical protein